MKYKFYKYINIDDLIKLPEKQILKELKKQLLNNLDDDIYKGIIYMYLRKNMPYGCDLLDLSLEEKRKHYKAIEEEIEVYILENFFIKHIDIIQVYDNSGKWLYNFSYKDCRTKWGKQLIKDAYKVK